MDTTAEDLPPAPGVVRVRVGHRYDVLALLFREKRGFCDVDFHVTIIP